jgi:ATP-binding cassette subfamily C protein CydD
MRTTDDRAVVSPGEARSWLEAAAGPGRSRLRLAGLCQTLETVFSIVQWAALAWVAQDVLVHRLQPGRRQLGLLIAGSLLAAAASWSAARFQAAGRRQIAHVIRQRLVTGLLPSGQWRQEPDAATAALATVESTDDIADHHAQAIPARLSAPLSMAAILLVTAAVQWPAAVILLVASLFIPANLRLAGLLAQEGADERAAAIDRLAAVVLDSFRGLRTLQGIGAVARRRDELADAAATLDTTTMAVVRRAFVSGAVMEVVITFSIAADATYIGLSLLGYVRLAVAPTMTLFSGLLALLLCPLYFRPFRAMTAAYHSRERAAAAAPTIIRLLAGAEVLDSAVRPVLPPAGPITVVLDAVTFRPADSGDPVLAGVNTVFDAGGWTAVVGPSGAGKTTLLSLIAGLRQPTGGSVQWVTATGAWTPQLGSCAWIGQQTVLLPGSIRDNIRIGRPGAGPSEVEKAVAAAGLTDVVARLPQGLGTSLGEGGSGVSTGEARRIAIARAFLSDASLWLLDEPTAHLDPEAEAHVIDALRRATRGRTVVVATHSAALARAADTVLGLADGTIIAIKEVTAA